MALVLPRPGPIIERELHQRDIQIGADGSILRIGSWVYILWFDAFYLDWQVQQIDFFHGMSHRGVPFAQTTNDWDVRADQMIGIASHGFGGEHDIIKVKTSFIKEYFKEKILTELLFILSVIFHINLSLVTFSLVLNPPPLLTPPLLRKIFEIFKMDIFKTPPLLRKKFSMDLKYPKISWGASPPRPPIHIYYPFYLTQYCKTFTSEFCKTRVDFGGSGGRSPPEIFS